MTIDLDTMVADYRRDGYCFPIDVMSAEQAADYRAQLEAVERARGAGDARFAAATFRFPHLVMPFADEITRLPAIVEPVKALLGPDLLVWGVTFFVKEARTRDYVSWHQDLTYWDLDDVTEVTAWVGTVARHRAERLHALHPRQPHQRHRAAPRHLRRGQHSHPRPGAGRRRRRIQGRRRRAGARPDVPAPRAHLPWVACQPVRRPTHRRRHSLHHAGHAPGVGSEVPCHPGSGRGPLRPISNWSRPPPSCWPPPTSISHCTLCGPPTPSCTRGPSATAGDTWRAEPWLDRRHVGLEATSVAIARRNPAGPCTSSSSPSGSADYWGGAPAFETVVFKFATDPAARIAEIASGRSDLTLNIPFEEIERLRSKRWVDHIRVRSRDLVRNAGQGHRAFSASAWCSRAVDHTSIPSPVRKHRSPP